MLATAQGEALKLEPVMLMITVRGLSLPLAARERFIFTACHKENETNLPLQLTGAYRLEGTTFANRLAASRKYKQSWLNS